MKFAPLAALTLLACMAGANGQILVGQTTGISGNSAANVKETTQGAMLWIDAVNAKGGINGQRVEIVRMDDHGDAKLAQANARQLIEERKVVALFMVRGTPQNLAILPLLEQYSVPMIAPSTGAMVLRTPVQRHVFNVRGSYQEEAEKAIVQLAGMGISRVAVLKTRDDFGEDTWQGAQRGFGKTGLKPVLLDAFDKAKPDFKPLAPRVVASNAQAVLILGTGTAVVNATKELRSAGTKATIVTLSNNASGGFVQELGTDGRGVVVTQVFPSERAIGVPMIKEATELLHAAKGGELTPAMIEGYASAKVLVEALRRAGPTPTRASIEKAMDAMSHFDLGGLTVQYSPADHNGVRYTEMSVIDANGTFRR